MSFRINSEFLFVDCLSRTSVSGKPGRNRPTLDDLLDEKTIHHNERYEPHKEKDYQGPDVDGGSAEGVIKFGWFDGVFMRCLLNIWGVMLFLRLTWVVGQSGLLEGLAIITLSNVVTLITAISMSAVSTNGQIKAGGIYYMISRSLGPEFGGAIGLTFTLANSIAVSMYLIGFCEALMDLLSQILPDFTSIVGMRVNDIRLIGSVSLVLILGLAIVGMDWVTRVQMVLLFLLLIAQADFIIGSFLPPSDEAKAKGFVGYNGTILKDNLWSAYTADPSGKENSFFTVFAVFFPAVTGIVAGANLSGDLKDPGVAIPKGTLLAIATTYISYMIYAVMMASCSLRLASGVSEEVHFGTDLFNDTVGAALNITRAFDDCEGRRCEFGLSASQQMMEVVSAWGPLIYAGCFAATLSSAIASLVGAPRVFQAVAKDKLFPFIGSFAEGWGANNDPVRGYILVFIISLVCILIGDLNVVSSLLSNFFVAAYALINFSVFHASITNSPGWRPSFRYYNKWISLMGTALCIVVMFLMDYTTALITFICIICLYLYVHVRNPEVNWGSSTQSQSFISALKAVQTLARVEDHVKNYRPKLIVMTGDPSDRPCLIDFANLLTKRISLLECQGITNVSADWKEVAAKKQHANNWLRDNHVKAFYAVTRSSSFSEGVRVSIELSGLGKLSPNMMLMGFCRRWKEDPERCREYYKAIKAALDLRLAVGVLRVAGGLDISDIFGVEHEGVSQAIARKRKLSELSDSSGNLEDCGSSIASDRGKHVGHDPEERGCPTPVVLVEEVDEEKQQRRQQQRQQQQQRQHARLKAESSLLVEKLQVVTSKKSPQLSGPLTDKGGNPVDEETIERIVQYRTKSPSDRAGKKDGQATIDVYWLYDDGGLTLLLPHILTTRSKFSRCRLRVFFLSDKIDDLDMETRSMATLLAKFRIAFQDVILLSDVTKKPSRQTRDEFRELIANPASVLDSPTDDHLAEGNSDLPPPPPPPSASVLSASDLLAHSEKTSFHLRVAEIIRQNSSSAELVVMTLPLPKKGGSVSAPPPPELYMAWLDMITRNMPPFLLIRGNQESVLTFYS